MSPDFLPSVSNVFVRLLRRFLRRLWLGCIPNRPLEVVIGHLQVFDGETYDAAAG